MGAPRARHPRTRTQTQHDSSRAQTLVGVTQSPHRRIQVPPPTSDRILHRRLLLSPSAADHRSRRQPTWRRRASLVRQTPHGLAEVQRLSCSAFLEHRCPEASVPSHQRHQRNPRDSVRAPHPPAFAAGTFPLKGGRAIVRRENLCGPPAIRLFPDGAGGTRLIEYAGRPAPPAYGARTSVAPWAARPIAAKSLAARSSVAPNAAGMSNTVTSGGAR